jgi:uncharacterized protein (DUF1501 family)
MPTRRTFLKQSAGLVAAGVILPSAIIREARAGQSGERKIFVVIQLQGGNDGLNTVIPYTDSLYKSYRPLLHFEESELKDDAGNSMLISSSLGLHPSLKEIKSLYDAGRVAIVQGVGYPSPSLSHFSSMDIWHTANPAGSGLGWLGRYADIKLAGRTGFPAAAIGNAPVKSVLADKVVIPTISNFEEYRFTTDDRYPGDRNNQVAAFDTTYGRSFSEGSYLATIASTGRGAIEGATEVQGAIDDYRSGVAYPENNPLAEGMKMLAQIITTIDEADLLYVQMGGFDNHSGQIGFENNQPSKLAGDHARLLRYFSQAVKAFYDDMAEHGLADRVLMMQWSEFGRRPRENASLGSDHGTVAPVFIIGNAVAGGVKGEWPALSDLDVAGNLKFSTDFRSVYGEILDRWLGVDSREVLGSKFEQVGFLN